MADRIVCSSATCRMWDLVVVAREIAYAGGSNKDDRCTKILVSMRLRPR